MGITNKLLQKALQKQTHSSRQPEAVAVTCGHTVGENGLGLNGNPPSLPNCSRSALSADLDGTEDIVLWPEQDDKSDTDSDEGNNMYDDMMTHEQMFRKESDDDKFLNQYC